MPEALNDDLKDDMKDGLKREFQEEATKAAPGSEEDETSPRRRAIKQIERRRHFHMELAGAAVASVLLIAIWATSEYHNAGGWPTAGFSQSSGIHAVWNYWIV